MIKKNCLTIFVLIVSILLIQILNHSIIEPIVIGNECQYDMIGNETTKLFDLFYNISSNTGYHPEPTLFNFIFTTIIGFLVGILLSYRLFWISKNKKN